LFCFGCCVARTRRAQVTTTTRDVSSTCFDGKGSRPQKEKAVRRNDSTGLCIMLPFCPIARVNVGSQRCRSETSWFANKNHPINGVAAVQSRDWKRSWSEFNAYKSSVAQSCDKAHGPISSLNRPRSFHQTRRLTFAGIFPMHVTCQMSCPARPTHNNHQSKW
jgi:hypothetical protein